MLPLAAKHQTPSTTAKHYSTPASRQLPLRPRPVCCRVNGRHGDVMVWGRRRPGWIVHTHTNPSPSKLQSLCPLSQRLHHLRLCKACQDDRCCTVCTLQYFIHRPYSVRYLTCGALAGHIKHQNPMTALATRVNQSPASGGWLAGSEPRGVPGMLDSRLLGRGAVIAETG